MRLSWLFLANVALAAYPGDIVSLWSLEAHKALPASDHGAYGLTGVMEGWAEAYIHAAILAAAEGSAGKSREVQQVAVSHAAHNAITSIFPTNKAGYDKRLGEVLKSIGASAEDGKSGASIGQDAFAQVQKDRAGDGAHSYVEYKVQPAEVGVYQPTPPNFPIPQSPQGQNIKPFGGIKENILWKAPPAPDSEGYEAELQTCIDFGGKKSKRTDEQTQIAFFWGDEGSTTRWGTIARHIIADKLKDDIQESARLFSKISFSFANAGFIGWKAKYHYNAWRPIHAIRWPEVYLASGKNHTVPDWEPLSHTPTHPEYLSGHALFGAAAGRVLTKWQGDKIDPPIKITQHTSLGMITRSYTSLKTAIEENSISRVWVGAHFKFACDEGILTGYKAADDIEAAFSA